MSALPAGDMLREALTADKDFMRAALGLARRGLGATWPNPSVGCVIVSDGRVVGRGRTGIGGRPHGEAVALTMAGNKARGATAYVTLEPCSHHGQTPPCAQALIDARVARVVIGHGDPDPRVNGAGVRRLREADIAVHTGVLENEAAATLAGFLTRVKLGRPLITLKLATTLDGKIATRIGESQWITGEPARKAAHAMRGQHDAVMVGVGTVLADNPDLTCRIPGYSARPVVRVVTDSHLHTPLTARIVATARDAPTWLLHRNGADPARRAAFVAAGVPCLEVADSSLGIDLAAGFLEMGAAGLTSVLVEGGGTLAAALLRADLVDRLAWFHAPGVIGGDGLAAAQAFGVAHVDAMKRFSRVALQIVGDDVLSVFVRVK